MRSIITGIYIAIYVASVNVWIYKLANGQLTLPQNRILGYSISLFMALCLLTDYKIYNAKHNPFFELAIMCFCVNFLINILNYTGIFGHDAPNMFYTFNGLIFAITSLIIYWGRKHGLFNE